MWMVLLSASAQATDTWTRREPASLAGIEAAPVGFASLLYRGEPGLLGAIEREPTDVVLSRLLSHEIPVAGAATPFGDPLPAGVVLGGTAHGVDFVRYDGELGWKAHVDWQLRDERTMQVLYETTTTGYVAADHGDDVASRAAHLLEVAVDQLAARPRFVEALAGVTVPPPPEPGVLRRCESPVASLPGDFKAAEAAVVEVIAGDEAGEPIAFVIGPPNWLIPKTQLPRARPKAWKRTRPKLMKAERD